MRLRREDLEGLKNNIEKLYPLQRGLAREGTKKITCRGKAGTGVLSILRIHSLTQGICSEMPRLYAWTGIVRLGTDPVRPGLLTQAGGKRRFLQNARDGFCSLPRKKTGRDGDSTPWYRPGPPRPFNPSREQKTLPAKMRGTDFTPCQGKKRGGTGIVRLGTGPVRPGLLTQAGSKRRPR